MTHERYHRLRALFASAIELDPVSRSAFLDEACCDDPELRRELESMVDEHYDTLAVDDAMADGRIERNRQHIDRVLTPDSSNRLHSSSTHGILSTDMNTPRVIGRYRIERRIASGGMGSVYLAEQDTPQRTVALKMVHAQCVSTAMMDRLQRESEILGRLQHPGIAQVFDAGVVDLGAGRQPFFAMEYIDGVSLTKYCDRNQLDDCQRLDMLARVCDAVQYAHEKGVIHRDLKPDNILVQASTATARHAGPPGRPKILDFGIAKATGGPGANETMTQEGQVLGTLAYMAPEQLETSRTVTSRADIYALGVIGFELLAGRRPHDLSGKSTLESLRYLTENHAPRLGHLDRRFRGDIDTIINTALAHDPAERYESAAALAADLRRHLSHQPILARSPSPTYLAQRFIRRHRVLVGGAAAVFLALLAGIIRTEHARANTAAALSELEQVMQYQESQLASIDPESMGIHLRDTLFAGQRAYLEGSGHGEADIARHQDQLHELLTGINFTDLALGALKYNIFDRSLEAMDAQFGDQPLLRARLLRVLGNTIDEIGGLHTMAVAALDDSLEMHRDLLGDAHPSTLAAVRDCLECDNDKYNATAARFLPIMEEVLGPDAPTTLHTRALLCAGNRNEGLNLIVDDILPRMNRTLGPRHPITIWTTMATGQNLARAGFVDTGALLLKDALEAVDPGDARLRLNMLHASAGMLWRQGRLVEAEAQIREALGICREQVGSCHNTTLKSRRLLAVILESADRLIEAESELLDVVSTAADCGWMDKDFAVITHNLGIVQYKLGRLTEAESRLRSSLELRHRASDNTGKHRIGYIGTAGNLAMVLTDLNQLDEAEALGREAATLAMDHLGADSSRTAYVRAQWARALGALGHYEAALAEMLAAQHVLLQDLGPAHERTRRVRAWLVDLYDAWHKAEPGRGFDDEARRWRAALETRSTSVP